MQARFVIGPAGSGKTFRCLSEIRRALLDDPAGPPLIFLAPKQATFQLERQLLADEALHGYTRLQILSFERLASHIFDLTGVQQPALLSAEGRAMVLHALLARRRNDLKIFHASAGLPGFAQQLSAELRELQQRKITPEILRQLAAREEFSESLRRKLHDLALLLTDYLEWLAARGLQDSECLLALAVETLAKAKPDFELASTLWLDGFAEMTPAEMDLLAAVAVRCDEANLFFCLETSPGEGNTSWLSIWTGLSETYRQCATRFAQLPNTKIETEKLRREPASSRFGYNKILRHLEENWSTQASFPVEPAASERCALKIVECADPAAEAVFAAHEILEFVRNGGRYREAAVLVRTLDHYHDHLRRAFERYEIPFFLDRRRFVAQHPLAEFTRSVLRAAVFGWQHDDWFGALKTGLVTHESEAVDRLENEALARGWKGETWFNAFPLAATESESAERVRKKWIAPFAEFKSTIAAAQFRLDGKALAEMLRKLWSDVEVERKLEQWSKSRGGNFEDGAGGLQTPGDAVHATIWTQLNEWLDDISLAFEGATMHLRDWLPILESGLAELSVGVIPPVLDQVLIGAVDRSRNPELKLAIVLGVNETVFPARPGAGHLLIESDRDELASEQLRLAGGRKEFLSRERFFGYIACTRSSERLVVSYVQEDNENTALNPSPFITQLQRMFPQWNVEKFSLVDEMEPEHLSELAGPIARAGISAAHDEFLLQPAFAPLREQMFAFERVRTPQRLEPGQVERMYGPLLRTSVSGLEEFAACPYRFFVRSGLRAEERQRFEVDVRERGSFQHEVLEKFHRNLRAENKKWRDIIPNEARERIQRAVDETLPNFHGGLLASDSKTRFTARTLTEVLQEFAASSVEWMAHYQFDPHAVELSFGMDGSDLPAWVIDLGQGHRLSFRGKIDRIDLCRLGNAEEALIVVIDYKSSARKLEEIRMRHGLQLQLAAYLGFLRRLSDTNKIFGVPKIVPGGVFYVNLRGEFENGRTRREMIVTQDQFRQRRFQHLGRFDHGILPYLDARGLPKGTQFKFAINKDGAPSKMNSDLMTGDAFEKMLDMVEAELSRIGREIYDGVIQLNPYKKGTEVACDKCDFQGICRIDPSVATYRVLK